MATRSSGETIILKEASWVIAELIQMGKKKKKAETVGVRSGLLWAIASLLMFAMLRYGLAISLLFSVITGFSVGFILRWWKNEEGPRAKLHLFANLKKAEPKKSP